MAAEGQPLLFIKTGVLCAEPEDFYDLVAERYHADLHATDDVVLEINDGHFSRSRDVVLRVRAETERRTADSIGRGVNAMYEGFLNTRQRRQEVIERVAEPAGASVILLCVHAPMPLIIERIKDRYQRNKLSLPSSETTVEKTIKVANAMDRTVQWPRFEEMPINLNGKLPASRLLSSLAEQLVSEGRVS